MYRILFQITIGIIGIHLASNFVEGVTFTGDLWQLTVAGAILGSLNFFLKPILKIVLLPLRLLTLGLFTIVINMAILWGVDLYLETLTIEGIIPLFLGTILISILSMFLGIFLRPKK